MTTTPTPASQAADLHAVVIEAAQVLESAAAHNRAKGRTVLAHSQQDRADRLRIAVRAAEKAQESAPSSESIDTPEFREYVRKCSVTWDTYEWDGHLGDLIKYIDARRATAGTTAAPTEKEKLYDYMKQLAADAGFPNISVAIAQARWGTSAAAPERSDGIPGDLRTLTKFYHGASPPPPNATRYEKLRKAISERTYDYYRFEGCAEEELDEWLDKN
jgi:hypothetical protein